MSAGGIHPLLIDHLEKNIKEGKNTLCVVPSVRYKKTIVQALEQKFKKVFKMPKIYSFTQLAAQVFWEERLTPFQEHLYFFQYLQSIDPELEYKAYKKWGGTLLNDFDLLDNYLLSAQNLGRLMKEVYQLDIELHHELQDIKIFQKEVLPIKQKFLQIWTQFQSIYNGFNAYLASKGKHRKAYQMRLMAENKTLLLSALDAYEEVLFMEFNAITACEKQIMKLLQKEGKGKSFISMNAKWLQQDQVLTAYFANKHKDVAQILVEEQQKEIPINILALDQELEQIFYTIQGVQQDLLSGYDASKIAIVLGEETLALPLLQNLKGFPINMGVALNANFNEGDKIVAEWIHYRKELSYDNSSNQFYKHFYQWLELYDIDQKRYFGSFNFKPEEVLSLLSDFEEKLKERNLYALVIDEMKTLLNLVIHEGLYFNNDVLLSLYNEAKQRSALYFKGDPNQAVQVLGLLETRGLSFDKIYFLSLKEGAIPDTSMNSSFIPYEFYKDLGLPMQQQKEALFANYLYNLMDASKEAVLMYPKKKIAEGQMASRFIEQIRYHNSSIGYKVQELSFEMKNDAPKIKKDQVMQLNDMFKQAIEDWSKKISPSALAKYLNCPKDFYYSYVLKLKDEAEKSIMEANDFGSIIHNFIEDLFNTLINEAAISVELFEQVYKAYHPEEKLKALFLDKVKDEKHLKSGKAFMALEAAQHYLKNFKKMTLKELKNGKLRVLSNELKLKYEIEGVGVFQGTMDRLDEYNGEVRIIDYKTSKTDNEKAQLTLKNVEDVLNPKKEKAFQLMFYQWVYYKTEGVIPRAYLFMIKKNVNEFTNEDCLVELNINNNPVSEEDMDTFEDVLLSLVNGIKHAEHFEHNPNAKYCVNC